MGVCSSTPQPARGSASKNGKESEELKILLLGAGGSGKSTIFKQLIRHFGPGFSLSDKQDYTAVIASNVLDSMRILCEETPSLSSMDQELLQAKQSIQNNFAGDDELDEIFAKKVQLLWDNPHIKETWQRRDFQINDTAPYFFDKIFELARRGHQLSDRKQILFFSR